MAKPTKLIKLPEVTTPVRYLGIVELNISPTNKRGMVVLGVFDEFGNLVANSPNTTLTIQNDAQYDALFSDVLADSFVDLVKEAGILFQQFPIDTVIVAPTPEA